MKKRWILILVLWCFAAFVIAANSDQLVQSEVDQINAALLENTIHSRSESLWPHLINNFKLSRYDSNVQVQRQIVWWLEHKDYLNSVLHQSKPYLAYIYQQVQSNNIPAEFALLPAIESDYNPFAYSKAGAAGLWQMMPATATNENLTMNWWYDGRRDTVASTKAALSYLHSLHSEFNSWILAAAAYNDGMGAVKTAEQDAHSNNFWQLHLPTETRDYVPRLLALANVIANAKHYRITLPAISYQPVFAKFKLSSQLDLAEIAHLAEVSIAAVKELNPGMRRFATDPDISTYLLLPASHAKIFLINLNRMSQQEHVSWRYHEVQEGETFAKLCQVFHTNSALLEWVNHLPSARVVQNQDVLVPLDLHETFGQAYLAKAPVDRGFRREQDQITAAVNKVYHSVV